MCMNCTCHVRESKLFDWSVHTICNRISIANALCGYWISNNQLNAQLKSCVRFIFRLAFSCINVVSAPHKSTTATANVDYCVFSILLVANNLCTLWWLLIIIHRLTIKIKLFSMQSRRYLNLKQVLPLLLARYELKKNICCFCCQKWLFRDLLSTFVFLQSYNNKICCKNK